MKYIRVNNAWEELCPTYTAGSGLILSEDEFSVNTSVIQPKLTAGANIDISNNTISATDTTYTAGTGIAITNGVISCTFADGDNISY